MDPTAGAGELVLPFLDRLRDVMFIRGFRPRDVDGLFGGFDVGRTNPTAFLAAAMLPNKTLVFFWEYYKRHALLNDMAMAVTRCPWYPGMEWISCDPSIWDRNQYKKEGMTSLAQMLQDEVLPEYRIEKMMKAHGRNDQVFVQKFSFLATNTRKDEMGNEVPDPKILIDEDGCPNFTRELRGLRYRESGIDRNASEKIVDKDNHLVDCAKYIILSHPETHTIVPRHKPGTVGGIIERNRVAQMRMEEFGMEYEEAVNA